MRDPLRSKDAHTDSKFEGFYSLFAAAAQTLILYQQSSFVNTFLVLVDIDQNFQLSYAMMSIPPEALPGGRCARGGPGRAASLLPTD